MFPVYLGLGSNIGNREGNLSDAIHRLNSENVIVLSNISDLYETEPKYLVNQEDFYNIVIEGKTQLSCSELLSECKRIESEMGRDFRQIHNGPRIIDIDILFYDRLIETTNRLKIPHPGITERRFVLQPLMDVAADFIHPIENLTVKLLYEKCMDPARVIKIKDIKNWISN